MSDRSATAVLLCALAATGALAWWFQLRPALVFDGARLAELPLALGEWSGQVIPVESAVERILRADLNLQRRYRRPGAAGIVWLYVGYYSTGRGGRPEHTPSVCYPAAGWEIRERRTWAGAAPGDRANEFVVESGGARRLVHFWYRSSRSTGLLGIWSVSVDQLASRLSSGRADGALVRLSTPIVAGDVDAARGRLLAFRRELAPELAARWPAERPPEAAVARHADRPAAGGIN